MKPIPVLGIPILNRGDLLHRCIASIDYPVDTLVIVQNGPDSEMCSLDPASFVNTTREFEFIKKIVHIKHPNAGVGGSWNEIMVSAPSDWWLISGNDIQFTPGDLSKLAASAWENCHDTAFLFGNHGHSLFVWTRYGVETLGGFDFNIFPAYTEDTEMSHRADLVGAKQINVQDIHAIHGEAPSWGSSTIHSDASLRQQNGGTHGRNWQYYIRKWGGMPGEEKFPTPYNIPGAPIDYIHFSPTWRAGQQWN